MRNYKISTPTDLFVAAPIPWKVAAPFGGLFGFNIMSANEDHIAVLQLFNKKPEVVAAASKLLAAAPSMFLKLKSVIPLLEIMEADTTEEHNPISNAIGDIKALLDYIEK